MRPVVFLTACASLLAGCGGGGNDGGAAAQPDPDPIPRNSVSIDVSSQRTSMSINDTGLPLTLFPVGSPWASQINVDLAGDFDPASETVNLSVSNGELGLLFSEADPEQPPSNSLQVQAVNGDATAIFYTRSATGTVTITASVVDDGGTPNDSSDDVTRSDTVDIVVDASEPAVREAVTVALQVEDPTLSANTSPLVFGPGSGFASLVTGEILISGERIPSGADDGVIRFSVVQPSLGQVSSTAELSAQSDAVDVPVANGTAAAVFHARDTVGQVELRASWIPPLDTDTVTTPVSTTIAIDDSTPPPVPEVAVAVQDSTLSANPGTILFGPGTDFATQVNVEVRDESGNVIDDVPVTLSVVPGEGGSVAPVGAPDAAADTIELVAANGTATAVYRTEGAPGPVIIRATADLASVGSEFDAVTGEATVTVDTENTPPERLTITATRTRLPANIFGVPIFLGSPYIAEATITFRDRFGNLSSPAEVEFGVSIDPVTIAAFSTLDDGETEDVNEFLVLLGNGPVDGAAGTATVFVHSFDEPGEATLRVTAQDPTTSDLFEATLDFQVVEPASDGAPANVVLNVADPLIFVQDSGGLTATQVEVLVFDGADEPVADPTDDNNVRLEVVGPEGIDASLSAVNVGGTQVSGDSIAIATTAGITSANVRAGSEAGFLRVRAISDAADNNVDNGIQAPVSDVFQFEITDGAPFAVTLAAFQTGQRGINPVNDGVRLVNADQNFPVPTVENGVYQLPVLAVVTDRQGNPPARPVTVRFGLLDAPLAGFPSTGPGTFALAGGDGDPQEGGTLFTAPGGAFQTAGGGAGPGDTLALFGRAVPGNADLEGVRTVDSVISETQLTVERAFNDNAEASGSADNGPVLPYAIGRAQTGNVAATAVTDAFGVAATTVTYPVSAVGRSVILYAQITDGPEGGTLADVAQGTFSALAPLVLVVSPDDVYANKTRELRVCTYDATGVPIPGVSVRFTAGTHTGFVAVDGQEDQGIVEPPTDFDGCTTATIVTSGVPISPTGDFDFEVTFEAGGVVTPLLVDASVSDQNPIAQVDILPETIIGDRLESEVLVRLTDVNGRPVSGLNIDVDCTSSQGAVVPLEIPGTTDANGEVIVRLGISGLDAQCPDEEPGVGTCVIDTTAVTANGEVLTVIGREGFLAPDSPICTGEAEEFELAVDYFEFSPGGNAPTDPAMSVGTDGNPLNTVVTFSDDGRIACSYNVATSTGPDGECTSTFADGQLVELSIQLGNVPFCVDAEMDDNDNGIIDDGEVFEGCFIGWAGSEECDRAVDPDGFPRTRIRMIVDRDMACTARFR